MRTSARSLAQGRTVRTGAVGIRQQREKLLGKPVGAPHGRVHALVTQEFPVDRRLAGDTRQPARHVVEQLAIGLGQDCLADTATSPRPSHRAASP